MSEKLITPKEAAQMLGYRKTNQVARLVSMGYLKPRYIPGSKWRRFFESEVLALIAEKPWKPWR